MELSTKMNECFDPDKFSEVMKNYDRNYKDEDIDNCVKLYSEKISLLEEVLKDINNKDVKR